MEDNSHAPSWVGFPSGSPSLGYLEPPIHLRYPRYEGWQVRSPEAKEAFAGSHTPLLRKGCACWADCLYSPNCLEEEFAETKLPLLPILGNSEDEKGRGCWAPALLQDRSLPLSTTEALHQTTNPLFGSALCSWVSGKLHGTTPHHLAQAPASAFFVLAGHEAFSFARVGL